MPALSEPGEFDRPVTPRVLNANEAPHVPAGGTRPSLLSTQGDGSLAAVPSARRTLAIDGSWERGMTCVRRGVNLGPSYLA